MDDSIRKWSFERCVTSKVPNSQGPQSFFCCCSTWLRVIVRFTSQREEPFPLKDDVGLASTRASRQARSLKPAVWFASSLEKKKQQFWKQKKKKGLLQERTVPFSFRFVSFNKKKTPSLGCWMKTEWCVWMLADALPSGSKTFCIIKQRRSTIPAGVKMKLLFRREGEFSYPLFYFSCSLDGVRLHRLSAASFVPPPPDMLMEKLQWGLSEVSGWCTLIETSFGV